MGQRIKIALVLIVSLLNGCVAAHRIDYPNDWASARNIETGRCPDITGTYVNLGTLRGWGKSDPLSHRNPNAWNGGVSLLANLIEGTDLPTAASTDLMQPDGDTLVVQLSNETMTRQWTLRRSSGDFDCDASGLTMSASGSVFSGSSKTAATDAVATIGSLLMLSGGVVSNTRSFRSLTDGSLVMEISQKGFITHGFAIGWDHRSFVRWEH